MKNIKLVTIPACEQHEGILVINILLKWNCPICNKQRGEIRPVFSYDGSRRLSCDGWRNSCGHIDKYSAIRIEAKLNGLN